MNKKLLKLKLQLKLLFKPLGTKFTINNEQVSRISYIKSISNIFDITV